MENLGITLQNYQDFGQGAGQASAAEVDMLLKAMSAGSITGRDTTGLTNASGAPLKVESLESTLKILTNKERDIVVWKNIPKLAATNTVEEYNQLLSYGLDGGAFNNEGELPESADSVYRRQAQLVKFMGTTREVTHPMQLVNTMVGNMIQRETINGTQWILRQVEKALAFGNADNVPQEWNGLYKQHQDGAGYATVDLYQDSEVVVDLRGKVLREKDIESAAYGINVNFGFADKLIAPPTVFSNFVKEFYAQKLISPNTDQVRAGEMGQKVTKVNTQFGQIDLLDSKFWKANAARLSAAAATSTKAPAAPVADGSTPKAVSATDTLSRWTGFNGDYFYAVAARNRYGESTLVQLGSAVITSTITTSIDLLFTDGGGSYPATSFVIYRSTKTPGTLIAATPLYPIFEITKAQLTAGFDGAAAGYVRDRNRSIANTEQALMAEWDSEILSFKQLAPLMKMDLAVLSPSTRFMVLLYGTPVVYAPRKMVRIINIGTDFTV